MNPSQQKRGGRPSYLVRVADAILLTPNMRRLTLEGNDLATLEAWLPAQWMKVILAPADAPVRPNRAYTIRRLDPQGCVVVMDFVLHGDTGPLSAWAARAQVGDTVYLGAPRGGHRINPEAQWRLLAGDETALPAIASILEALPADDVPAQVVIEVPSVADAQDLCIPRKGEVRWLTRDAGHEGHGHLLEAAVAALALSEKPGQVFMAGEARAIRSMKLDIARRASRADVDAKGYWLLGATDHRE